MKIKIAIMAVTGMLSSTVMAQNQYDALRLMDNELNGTARFVGMGGAMSALGADLSTIATNPAGIGMFRRNDVSVSFGFNNNRSKADMSGTVMTEKRTKASFDQAGFVWSTKIGNKTNMRYFNIAFNYHKRANFNRQFSSKGILNGASLTHSMADMLYNAGYDGQTVADLEKLLHAKNPYVDPAWYGTPYLAAMGFRTGLVDPLVGSKHNIKKENTSDQSLVTGMLGWKGGMGEFYSREEGGINEYDFNLSFNNRDRFYFGATIGVYDIHYSRYSSYGETLNRMSEADGGGVLLDQGAFTLNNYFKTEGVGFDLKVGTIIRPFEYSPFRVGFSVHTPVWYSMTDRYFSVADAFLEKQNLDPEHYIENTSEYLDGGVYLWDYNLTTPWRFNVSMGTTVSGMMALDAEYEFEKYSSAKYKDPDGNELNATSAVGQTLKGVHTFRVGMETKLSSAFSIRAGYNFRSAPIHDDSFKNIPFTDETRTDAEYLNLKSRQALTFGLGFRGRMFYADLAYKYDFYKADFYAFDDLGGVVSEIPTLSPTKVNNERHQLLFTLGMHF